MLYPLSYGGSGCPTRLAARSADARPRVGASRRGGNTRTRKIVRETGARTGPNGYLFSPGPRRGSAYVPGNGAGMGGRKSEMSSTQQVRVEDVPTRGRFEVSVDDRVVGLASYHVDGDVMTLPHTEVDPSVAGRGIGTTLVEAVLTSAREQHLTVLPYCSFVRHYLHEHPTDVDLVAEADRPHFGLELAAS